MTENQCQLDVSDDISITACSKEAETVHIVPISSPTVEQLSLTL
jgi:hypothetical protein